MAKIHPPNPTALPVKRFVLEGGEQVGFFNSQNVITDLSTLSSRADFGCYRGQTSVRVPAESKPLEIVDNEPRIITRPVVVSVTTRVAPGWPGREVS